MHKNFKIIITLLSFGAISFTAGFYFRLSSESDLPTASRILFRLNSKGNVTGMKFDYKESMRTPWSGILIKIIPSTRDIPGLRDNTVISYEEYKKGNLIGIGTFSPPEVSESGVIIYDNQWHDRVETSLIITPMN